MPTLWNEENVRYLGAQDIRGIFRAELKERESWTPGPHNLDAVLAYSKFKALLVDRFRPLIQVKYAGDPDWVLPVNGAISEGILVSFPAYTKRDRECVSWDWLLDAERKATC